MPEASPGIVYIPLSKGRYAIIDAVDSDVLDDLWYLGRGGYAVRMDERVLGKQQWLHKLILSRVLGRTLISSEFVDHRNRNRLDNRRENLRIATRAQNNANRKSSHRSTSQYLGVYWHTRQKRWAATLRTSSTQIHIGYFDNEAEAAWMYDQWAVEIHGEFANPNFAYI
ncbi:hypothetical protein G3I13_01740 [Streptomyces sp. SID6673]|nr:hypothetical protein [Streptomyces sp. SID11726]NDZ94883.1 hypothetical protein [Streptomyces sp. SID11726]NEB23043.1 hypothetical protein [Streptomyces sp. SID6673]